MERWEYQVIHLNVEAPAPAPPAPPPAAPPSVEPQAGAQPIRVEAVFSKEYLEKEFPGFYGAQPPAGAPAREHPANQLRGFLNLQGRDGWQLLGFYPVGQLTMMIFRRPLQQAEAAGVQAPAAAVPQADQPGQASGPGELSAAGQPPLNASASPAAGSGPSSVSGQPVVAVEAERAGETVAGETGGPPPDQALALERILARLEDLERRLSPPAAPLRASHPAPSPPSVSQQSTSQPQEQASGAAGAAQASGAMPPQPGDAADLQDGEILPPRRLDELRRLPRLSTPQAARALGFRSAASLLNLAARCGYPEGLVKRGGHGAVAVYVGSERSGRGGRDLRLWVVLQAPAG